MVRSLSTSRRAHSRRFAVSALATSIALALGSAHAQTVSATSVPITGRAPVVTIASITNQTVPGQAPAVGHVLHANASAVDPDDDAIIATNYRWKRGGVEVGTGVDYATTLADAGQTLTLEVEATTDSAITDPDRGSATSTVAVVANTAPTAAPTITYTGALVVGTVLTANSGFDDIDNDAEAGTTYQWCAYNADDVLMGCAAPSTTRTWTVLASNNGQRLSVKVIPKSASGNPDTGLVVESDKTALVGGTAPIAENQSVSGTLKTGSTLSAVFDYRDDENDPQGEHLYQWYRDDGSNKTNIDGATAKDYILTGAEQGDHYIGVRITPVSTVAPTGGTPVFARTATKFTGNAPTATPTISFVGGLGVGTVLTGAAGFIDADNDPEGTHTYQWYRADDASRTNQVAIASATSATYTVTGDDQGKFLVLGVIPRTTVGIPAQGTEGFGVTASAVSVSTTAPIAENQSVSGTLKTGNTLSAVFDYRDDQNDPQGDHKYQWYRDDGANKVNIAGATSKDYVLTSADQGDHYIGVRITPVSTIAPTDGAEVFARTAAKFTGNAPTAAPTITFDGALTLGTVLTAHSGFDDVDNDIEAGTTYQWCQYTAAGTLIGCAGTTSTNTWTIVAANVGNRLSVKVIPKSATGTPATGVEVESLKTAFISGPPTATPTISGSTESGSTLTANSGYDDVDNDPEGETTYQWCAWDSAGTTLLGCAEPSTSNTWVINGSEGRRLSVKVVPKSANGQAGNEAQSAKTAVVTGHAPTAAPTITGTVALGQELTANSGFNDIENDAEAGTTYQWCLYPSDSDALIGCAAPSTSNKWMVVEANMGRRLSVKVVPKAASGAVTTGVEVESAKTTVVGTPPTATPGISFDSGLGVGSVLTADSGYDDVDDDLEEGTTYEWCAWDFTGTTRLGCAAPSTEKTWTVTQGNVSRRMSVRVIPRSANGETGAQVESYKLEAIPGSAPTAAPTISGTTRVGSVLTANPGFNDVDNDPQGGTLYQWCAYDGATGTELLGCAAQSTSNTWTLPSGNLGHRLSVKVIPKTSIGDPDTGAEVESAKTAVIDVSEAPIASGQNITASSSPIMNTTTLTANFSYGGPVGQGEHLYHWYSYTNPSTGAGKTSISAQSTSNTWVVNGADFNQAGRYIGVDITPVNANGVQGATVQAATAREAAYRCTGFSLTQGYVSQTCSYNVGNRVSNPSVVRVIAHRNTSGSETGAGSVQIELIAPGGQSWTIAGPAHGGTVSTAINVSGASGNGTWQIKVKKAGGFSGGSSNTLYLPWVAMDFTGD